MTVSRSAPLLKAWLDENLPVIVEGLVSAQMEKQLCRHNSIGFHAAVLARCVTPRQIDRAVLTMEGRQQERAAASHICALQRAFRARLDED
jgi:hypothetical protein